MCSLREDAYLQQILEQEVLQLCRSANTNRRPRYGVAMGTALRPGNGAATAPTAQGNQRSWRVDETCVWVKGEWVYLYRAVDSSGATIDFLLSAKRDAVDARRSGGHTTNPSLHALREHRRSRRVQRSRRHAWWKFEPV
jgi:DDE domain